MRCIYGMSFYHCTISCAKYFLYLSKGDLSKRTTMTTTCIMGQGTKEQIGALEANLFHCREDVKMRSSPLQLLLLTHVLVHIAAATAFLEAVWSPNAFQVTKKKKKMTSIASGIITSGNESDQYSNNNCRRVSLVIENNAFHPLLRRSLEDVLR